MNDGKILIMADVPIILGESITHKVKTHTSAVMGGSEPSLPVFP